MAVLGNKTRNSLFTTNIFIVNDINQLTYILSSPAASNSSILVIIDGVKQISNTYVTIGTSLTFSEGMPVGTVIEVINLAVLGLVNTVSDNTISLSKLTSGSVDASKVVDNTITPGKLTTGAPVWDSSGNLTTTKFIGDGSLLTSVNGLGYGQTWQNFTGSRVLGTNYTNSTGKPIAISINAVNSSNAVGSLIGGINGVNIVTSGGSYGGQPMNVSLIIPNGATYYAASGASGVTYQSWYELR